jgi:hypothetical protein
MPDGSPVAVTLGKFIVANDGVCQFISLTRLHLSAEYGPLRSNSKFRFAGKVASLSFSGLHPERRVASTHRGVGCHSKSPGMQANGVAGAFS